MDVSCFPMRKAIRSGLIGRRKQEWLTFWVVGAGCRLSRILVARLKGEGCDIMGNKGLRHNLATVGLVGLLVATVIVTTPGVSAAADERFDYTFVFEHTDGTTTAVSGSDTVHDAYLPDAGGTDQSNPAGMTVHLSCSDDFPGGWGERKGPDPVADSEWRVRRYEIEKYKDGHLDNSCSGGDRLPPLEPAIDIEKATDGLDADTPTGPYVTTGSNVTWTYAVTNTGETELTDIAVFDDLEGAVSCPQDTLAAGASMTCTLSGSAIAGQYANEVEVTALGPNGLLQSALSTDQKQRVYSFTFDRQDR